MSDKKHIDKLFKEQFKDFESAPDDAVWNRIETTLHQKKKKRRILPIWWQLGGVAAILLLLLTIGNLVLTDSNESFSTPETIVNENNNESEKETQSNTIETKVVVNNDNDADQLESEMDELESNESTNSSAVSSSVAKNNNRNVIVDNSEDKSSTNLNESKDSKNNAVLSEYNFGNKKDAVVQNDDKNAQKSEEKSFSNSQLNPEKTEIKDKLNDHTVVRNDSRNLNDPETNTTPEDPIKSQEDLVEKNAIEEAIAQTNNEKEKEEVEKLNRWSISPNVAPVYFNTLGKGSSIGNDFVDNKKEGEVNVSYGIAGSYAFNDKLKIRAGINKVEMGYNTNNVLIYGGSDASFASSSVNEVSSDGFVNSSTTTRARNVNVEMNSQNTIIQSAQNIRVFSAPEIVLSQQLSSLDQRLGFIEIPVEMEYSLLNNRFGLNVIGGFSTLLLDTNEVFTVVDGQRTLLGEATNLNDTSFSANFGIGVNYNISEKLKLNLQPTFKYQLNTFSDTSGDFRPYFIGVYSGISFKF